MKVFLTGVAGFIGSHVAHRLLERGDEVVGIDNVNDYYDVSLKEARLANLEGRERFTFHKIDLADMGGIEAAFGEGCDAVCHLAAQAGVRYSLTHPHAYVEANLSGFMNILELCRHNGVGNLVYASSSSVYGGNEKIPFSEADRVEKPVSLYAATKASNELMGHCYHHLFNIPMTGLRFFTVYGPWGRPDMALFIFTRKILAGEPIDVFNFGKMRRDFTYIDDIVSGVVASIDNPNEFEIVNLGNSSTVELEHFISVIEDNLGKEAIKNYMELQAGDVVATYADTEKAKELYGWQPTTPIEAGIPRFVKWYREYYKV